MLVVDVLAVRVCCLFDSKRSLRRGLFATISPHQNISAKNVRGFTCQFVDAVFSLSCKRVADGRKHFARNVWFLCVRVFLLPSVR